MIMTNDTKDAYDLARFRVIMEETRGLVRGRLIGEDEVSALSELASIQNRFERAVLRDRKPSADHYLTAPPVSNATADR